MAKQYIADGPDVVFPRGTVFVRPATEEERIRFLSNNFTQEFYSLVDETGTTLSIVCGEHIYAFNVAYLEGAQPVWMH